MKNSHGLTEVNYRLCVSEWSRDSSVSGLILVGISEIITACHRFVCKYKCHLNTLQMLNTSSRRSPCAFTSNTVIIEKTKQTVTHSLLHSAALQDDCLLRKERLFSINCQLFLHILSTILSAKWSPEYTGSSRKPKFMSHYQPISDRRELHHVCRSDGTLLQYMLQSPV